MPDQNEILADIARRQIAADRAYLEAVDVSVNRAGHSLRDQLIMRARESACHAQSLLLTLEMADAIDPPDSDRLEVAAALAGIVTATLGVLETLPNWTTRRPG
jgi:hypothetical protein